MQYAPKTELRTKTDHKKNPSHHRGSRHRHVAYKPKSGIQVVY